MFETEVNFRLAKWIIAMLKEDGIITDDEMQELWSAVAKHYNPPFLEVDVDGGTIGDGVKVGER